MNFQMLNHQRCMSAQSCGVEGEVCAAGPLVTTCCCCYCCCAQQKWRAGGAGCADRHFLATVLLQAKGGWQRLRGWWGFTVAGLVKRSDRCVARASVAAAAALFSSHCCWRASSVPIDWCKCWSAAYPGSCWLTAGGCCCRCNPLAAPSYSHGADAHLPSTCFAVQQGIMCYGMQN